MHGTSRISFEDIKKAIKAGITKVNVGTDLLITYNRSLRKYFKKHSSAYDIRKINTVAIRDMKEKVIEYLRIFNS